MEDSQLLVKTASGDWVVVPGTKGWETGVRASGWGGLLGDKQVSKTVRRIK